MIKKFVMLGVIGFMAMGFPSFVFGGGSNSENVSAKAEQTQKEVLHLKTDNALDLKSLIGEDIKNLDIPEEAIEYIGARPFAVYYDGVFLDFPCTSILMGISYDFKTKVDKVGSITLSLKQPDFMKCKTYLDEQFGECYYSGSMPYVAVNGGAVTYFTYYKDGYKHHLSHASARNYYTLRITKEEPKGAPRHESTGMLMFQDFVPLQPVAPVSKPVTQADNREAWVCEECGWNSNKGKFCVECGKPRKK